MGRHCPHCPLGGKWDPILMDPLWIRYGIALLVPGEYAVLHPAAMEWQLKL